MFQGVKLQSYVSVRNMLKHVKRVKDVTFTAHYSNTIFKTGVHQLGLDARS